MKVRRPCENCPWRVDAPREPTRFLPCQGWARVMGFDAIGVRLAVMQGMLRLGEVKDRGGPVLFKTFNAMLRANKIRIPRRNRYVP